MFCSLNFGWRESSQLLWDNSVKAAVLASAATNLFIIQYESINSINTMSKATILRGLVCHIRYFSHKLSPYVWNNALLSFDSYWGIEIIECHWIQYSDVFSPIWGHVLLPTSSYVIILSRNIPPRYTIWFNEYWIDVSFKLFNGNVVWAHVMGVFMSR